MNPPMTARYTHHVATVSTYPGGATRADMAVRPGAAARRCAEGQGMTQNTSSAVMQQRSEPHDSLLSLPNRLESGIKRRPGRVFEHPTQPNRNGSHEDHVMASQALPLAVASRQEIQENWRPIEGWPGYEVSDQGRVRSWKQRGKARGEWIVDRTREPRVLRHDVRNGYPSVVLISKENGRVWASIHRLVLSAFVGLMPSSTHAAHGNGIKTDNRLANLRWATPAENSADKVAHGTRQNGDRAGTAKLTWAKVAKIRTRRASGDRVLRLAADFGVCRNTITNITTGKTWVDHGAE